jgi:hypothetical protein
MYKKQKQIPIGGQRIPSNIKVSGFWINLRIFKRVEIIIIFWK